MELCQYSLFLAYRFLWDSKHSTPYKPTLVLTLTTLPAWFWALPALLQYGLWYPLIFHFKVSLIHLNMCHSTWHKQRDLEGKRRGRAGKFEYECRCGYQDQLGWGWASYTSAHLNLWKDRQILVQFCWGSDPIPEVPHHLILESWLNSSPDNNITLTYILLPNFIGGFLHLTYFVFCLHVFFITCTLNMNAFLWCIFHTRT